MSRVNGARFENVFSFRGLWDRLTGRGFARNVAILAGGTALGQAIALLVSPLLTRLYSPADFGLLAVYTSVFTILLVFASLRYEWAIPLPEQDHAAVALLVLCLALVLGASSLAGLGVWLLGDQLVRWINAPGLGVYLWLLPLSLLGGGVHQALTYWATRRERFDQIAQSRIVLSVGQALTQSGLGLLEMGPLGLLLGQVVGQIGGGGALAVLIRRRDAQTASQVSVREVGRLARRYARFPLLTTGSSLLNSASSQAPTILLALFFEPLVVGWFALGLRVLRAPLRLIGRAVGQVYFARASEASRSGDLAAVTMRVYRQLVSLAAGPSLLLAVGGADLFALVFGEPWRSAGLYSQWLAPWLFLVFITSPLSPLVFVLELQQRELVFQGLLLGGRVAALLLGAFLDNATLAVQSYGLVGALLWAGYMLWLMRASGNRLPTVLAVLGREAVAAGLAVGPALLARLLNVSGWPFLVCGLASVGLVALHLLRQLRGWR